MQNYVIELKAQASKTFRCQKAADSLDIDVSKKLVHRLQIKNLNIPDNFNVGMVIGASGSGKTTLAKDLFKFKEEDVSDPDKPIIDQFPSSLSYNECAEILAGVGLNSVPCWIKPLKTLSNGQKARAVCALQFSRANPGDLIIIDEWTSVVDRNAAKAMSLAVVKYIKRKSLKVILLSCHYDIVEWIEPDWVIDCNEQTYRKHGKKKDRIILNLKSKNSTQAEVGNPFPNIII